MLFEAGSAVFFCGWCKKASIQQKGFGIFFSILAWVIFFTAIALSDNEVEGHEALMLGHIGRESNRWGRGRNNR